MLSRHGMDATTRVQGRRLRERLRVTMTGIFRRGMRDRPKHDRKLCLRCKYHGTVGAREDKMYNVCCDYAALAHDGTCLRREHGEMIDRRGEDFESCKLFEEGEALGRAEVGRKTADEAYRNKLRRLEDNDG